MFTAKEIVKELIESTGDNRWFINTKTIGTQVGHRHLPNLSIQRHVSEAVKRLTAKQKKIAAMAGDKNKIDADDLAKLRSMKENNDSHTHAAHFTNEKGEWSGMALIDAKDDDDAVDQAHKISAGNKWKNFKLASVERHVPVKEDASDIDKLGKKYAKAEKDEAEKQDTYSKKYPGGNKQKEADKAAFMKRFAKEEAEQIEEAKGKLPAGVVVKKVTGQTAEGPSEHEVLHNGKSLGVISHDWDGNHNAVHALPNHSGEDYSHHDNHHDAVKAILKTHGIKEEVELDEALGFIKPDGSTWKSMSDKEHAARAKLHAKEYSRHTKLADFHADRGNLSKEKHHLEKAAQHSDQSDDHGIEIEYRKANREDKKKPIGGAKLNKEEVEQIEELDKSTLRSYAAKRASQPDKGKNGANIALALTKAAGKPPFPGMKKVKVYATKEEVEQIDEADGKLTAAHKERISDFLKKSYGDKDSEIKFSNHPVHGHSVNYQNNRTGMGYSHRITVADGKVKMHPAHMTSDYYREEVEQIIEDATVRAWHQVHTKGSKAQREKLDKVHAKNPKYQEFKKSLGTESGEKSVKQASKAPEHKPAEHKTAEKKPLTGIRAVNAARVAAAMAKGTAHRSGGVGSAGTSANQSPLEKKLGGHDVSHLEKKKAPASLGASPSEREAEKAEKKEKPKADAVERKPTRLTGKKLSIKEMVSVGGTSVRGAGYVTGNPDGQATTYQIDNVAIADQRSDTIFKQNKTHTDMHRLSEELKVGEKDSPVKRKYLGKMRGKNKTGSKAHVIKINPGINDGGKHAF